MYCVALFNLRSHLMMTEAKLCNKVFLLKGTGSGSYMLKESQDPFHKKNMVVTIFSKVF